MVNHLRVGICDERVFGIQSIYVVRVTDRNCVLHRKINRNRKTERARERDSALGNERELCVTVLTLGQVYQLNNTLKVLVNGLFLVPCPKGLSIWARSSRMDSVGDLKHIIYIFCN